MRMKKLILCQGEAKTLKNGQKRTKNGYCVNSPLDKQNQINIAWIPEHAGVHRNKVADYVAKSGSIKNTW